MWDNSVRYHQSTENANSFYVQISTPPPQKKIERKREKIINIFNFYKIDRLTQ